MAGNDRTGGRDHGGLAHRSASSILEDARKKGEVVAGATARGVIILFVIRR